MSINKMKVYSSLKVLALACLFQVIAGSCHNQIFHDQHCTAPDGGTIPVGAELLIPKNCEKCSCSVMDHMQKSLIMTCCGYGIHAGILQAPSGCKVAAGEDGCSVTYVKIYDETKPCL